MNTSKKKEKDHISVCICTYKRPEMLSKAIEGVLSQVEASEFSFDIVIIDNDFEQSARNTVEKFKKHSRIKIAYDCEPQKNIALARNRAVHNASGNLIAFLDDDEIPCNEWLTFLYQTLVACEADGVLGPVIPIYPHDAPEWLQKVDLFQRARFETGTKLVASDTRTGNVLFKREIFGKISFDPRFGLTGGEDVDFFERQIQSGRSFVWCDEAEAFEVQPPERWKKSFFSRRYFRIGRINGKKARRAKSSNRRYLAKALLGIQIYCLVSALALPLGPSSYMKWSVKVMYYLGWICGFSGLKHVKLRAN